VVAGGKPPAIRSSGSSWPGRLVTKPYEATAFGFTSHFGFRWGIYQDISLPTSAATASVPTPKSLQRPPIPGRGAI